MATAARAMTKVAAPTMTWAERALYLMDEKRKQHGGLAWRASQITGWYADGTPATISIRVESQSIPEFFHTVTYHVHEDSARCNCTAGGFGRACCHAGVAIWYGRAVTAQYTPAARAEQRRNYERDLAAIDNRRVLGY